MGCHRGELHGAEKPKYCTVWLGNKMMIFAKLAKIELLEILPYSHIHGKSRQRKFSPKDFSTIKPLATTDSPPFNFGKTAQVYTLQERHKIPILSSTCNICPQSSHV